MILLSKKHTASFSLSLMPPVMIGLVFTGIFYGLIFAGPLDYPLLRRYCLCHEVAVITVGLFWISATAMGMKLQTVVRQHKLTVAADTMLRSILSDHSETTRERRAQWLDTMWQAAPTSLWESFLGQRVRDVLSRQIKRGNAHGLDEDLRQLADRDADRQHESYGLIRIAIWAMPMLGFLGTVIGIAGTLGQIDSEMLASGSQEAMNRITAGLYVAFDKTAIALALTMAAMFMQFAVQRIELGLLQRIDTVVEDQLLAFLAEDRTPAFSEPTYEILDKLTQTLAKAVSQVVEQQAVLWRDTIEEARECWVQSTQQSEATLRQNLVSALDESLSKHEVFIERTESILVSQVDDRWKQWQTTLSDQARLLQTYQRDQAEQGQRMVAILEKLGDLNQVQDSLDRNLLRLTDIDRFHEAAICMTEAIAFFATQMEKQGALGRKASADRKSNEPRPAETTAEDANLGIVKFPSESPRSKGRAA